MTILNSRSYHIYSMTNNMLITCFQLAKKEKMSYFVRINNLLSQKSIFSCTGIQQSPIHLKIPCQSVTRTYDRKSNPQEKEGVVLHRSLVIINNCKSKNALIHKVIEYRIIDARSSMLKIQFKTVLNFTTILSLKFVIVEKKFND